MNPFSFLIAKSLQGSTARALAKLYMISFGVMRGHSEWACAKMAERPSSVVSTSAVVELVSSNGSDVGPTMTVPSTVGIINIPFEEEPLGITENITLVTTSFKFLSRT